MTERRPARMRRNSMIRTRLSFLAAGLLVAMMASSCGSDGDADTTAVEGPVDTPTLPVVVPSCAPAVSHPTPALSVDLDGNGTAETFEYLGAGEADCATELYGAKVAGKDLVVVLPESNSMHGAAGVEAIGIPGRTGGDLVRVTQAHPRGGFQVRLIGYADGELAELTVDDAPVFPFVATDALATPISAKCTKSGFEVSDAQAHEPIGVAAAWDVFTTTYTVDGNTVTRGDRNEVADNVLGPVFEKNYPRMVAYRVLENCPPSLS